MSAKGRYLSKLDTIITEAKSYQVEQTKALDWLAILGSTLEIKIIESSLGKFFFDSWILAGNESLDDVYRLLEKPIPSNMSIQKREIAEEEIGTMAKEIDKTTRGKLQELIKNGIDDGLSNDQIADNVRRSGAFKPSRAKMIAQSETTKAINSATNTAYNQIMDDDPEIKILKKWIDSKDSKVRPAHRTLGQQPPIDAEKEFIVGSHSGANPGNFGVAALDINCRCTIAPVVVEK